MQLGLSHRTYRFAPDLAWRHFAELRKICRLGTLKCKSTTRPISHTSIRLSKGCHNAFAGAASEENATVLPEREAN
jgi:hypothetical protein